jgi:hypothetical protein
MHEMQVESESKGYEYTRFLILAAQSQRDMKLAQRSLNGLRNHIMTCTMQRS